MRRVRYVPGPNPDWQWGEAWVETREDGSPTGFYTHAGVRDMFRETLDRLVARGAWQQAIDPDLEVDEGL